MGRNARIPGEELKIIPEIGPRLRELRDALGMDKKEFGKKSALGPTNVATRFKIGINRKRAREIAAIFGCREEWLLEGKGRMFPEGHMLNSHQPAGPPPGPKDERPAMDKCRANKVRPKSDPFDDLMAQQVVRRCRVCGCTEDHACPGGCAWIEEPDPETGLGLCSVCFAKEHGLEHRVNGDLLVLMPPCPVLDALEAAPGRLTVHESSPWMRFHEIYYEDFILRKGFPVRLGIRAVISECADLDLAHHELVRIVQRKLDEEMDLLEAQKEALRAEIACLETSRDQIRERIIETSRTLAGMRTIASSGGATP